jgi:translation initiation factor eIF-2B subunit epsilon
LDDEQQHTHLGKGGEGWIWPEPSAEEDEGTEDVESFENQRFLVIGGPECDADSDTDSLSSEEEVITPQTPGAAARIGGEKEFLSECSASLERAFEEGHSVDNAAVELKTLRMASNVPLRRVREVIIRRLMERILAACGGVGTRAAGETRRAIQRWGGLVEAIGGADGVETVEILEVSKI